MVIIVNHALVLFILLLLSIGLIVLLIMKAKLNAFLALTISALLLGLCSGMQLSKVVGSFETGVGNTLSSLTAVIGLGTILGKMLEVSGGAQKLANTLINRFGKKRARYLLAIVAYLCGIPMFFQVGFILLIPIVYSVAKAADMSLIELAVPVAATLITVHSMVPPHPAAVAIVGTLHADMGSTILISLLVAIPAALIAGPVYARFIGKRVKYDTPDAMKAMKDDKITDKVQENNGPSVGITLWTILFPIILMVLKTIFDLTMSSQNGFVRLMDFIGDPVTALLIAALNAYFTMGFSRGLTKEKISTLTSECFKPLAGILLIIGAGGGYNQILQDSGIANMIGKSLAQVNISPLILGWLLAMILRFSVGSTTVAMITTAGLIAPLLAANPHLNPALMVVAIGAGGIAFSQVNDSGFWLVKEYLGTSVVDTFKVWTIPTIIAGFVGLICVLLASLFI